MHILFLVSEFPPAPGGIATYIDHTTRMLARAGHRVTVFTPGTTRRNEELSNGVRVIRLIRLIPHHNHTGFGASLFRTLSHWPALSYQFAEAVIEHLRSSGDVPDVIETQEYAALGYYLLQRRLVDDTPLAGIPILVSLHSPHFENVRIGRLPRYRFPDYWVGQMEKYCINAADARLSPSAFLRDNLLKHTITDQPIDVIPHPGFDQAASVNVQSPSFLAQHGDIVYVGRLTVLKGVLPLVGACARLWSTNASFRLTLIGDDTPYESNRKTVGSVLRDRYRRFIESGHLVICNPMPRERIMSRLRTAWAVVVPSFYESYAYTCIEAMSTGKVVIASASGGQAEMVGSDGQAGLLFDWADEGSFDRALLAALNMTVADNQAMGLRARERIAALASYDTVLPQRIAHYEKTIEQAAFRRRNRVFPSVNWDLKPAEALPRVEGLQDGLLSVVIPFHNLGVYVENTLNSVLASTYHPLEVIILDDGSDDLKSLATLDQLKIRHADRVRVVRTPNRGLAAARNAGAECAQGEYLAFVDADDLVLPSFFARAIQVLQSYDNVGFVYSWVQYFGDNDEWWPTWNTEFPYLLGHNMLVPIVVVRRAAFLRYARNRPELEYALEDWDAWVRLAAAGYQGVSLPHRLVRYRVRRNSMYRQLSPERFLLLQDMISHGSPEIYQRYAVELFNLMNANGPGDRWIHPAMAPQHSSYNALKQVFFWLASRPGMAWLHRLKKPLKKAYTRVLM